MAEANFAEQLGERFAQIYDRLIMEHVNNTRSQMTYDEFAQMPEDMRLPMVNKDGVRFFKSYNPIGTYTLIADYQFLDQWKYISQDFSYNPSANDEARFKEQVRSTFIKLEVAHWMKEATLNRN